MYLDESNIDLLDIKSFTELLSSNDVSTRSETVNVFEKECAGYLNVKATLATNSGTSALHAALLASEIGLGDEVILPATTFIATANIIKYIGAVPVFVDVDPDTWLIDLVCAKNALTEKTKAIISVDLYGVPCWNLAEFVTDYELIWISDSCESFGSKDINGNMLPAMADYVCYSFNGNKIMTTGSGGLLTSKHRDLGWAREIVNVGRDSSGGFRSCGYNYKMNGIQAALGLSQLKRIHEFVDKKRKFQDIYTNELIELLDFQAFYRDCVPNFWFTAVTYNGDLHSILELQGIPYRKIFYPVSLSHPYGGDDLGIKKKLFKVGLKLHNKGACLPSSTLNEEKDIIKVCKILKGIL
jgi:perosamine synthetase